MSLFLELLDYLLVPLLHSTPNITQNNNSVQVSKKVKLKGLQAHIISIVLGES